MSNTPLTDFLAGLSDPLVLGRFRADPEALISEAGLSEELAGLVLKGHPGAIRVRAVKELELAGLSPVVSDKFDAAGQQPMNISMNSYTTSSFTANTSTSTTFTTNTTDHVTTTTDQTTTTTHNSVVGEDWSIIDVIEQAIRYFGALEFRERGQLVVVGSGIRAIADITFDAEAHIRSAQKVLYCVADPVTERRLHLLNPSSESLYGLYSNDRLRIDTYQAMVDALMAPVRAGLRVCGVFYGHPGVFAWPTHQAVRVARRDGFRAEMHAAVSADASLFADLGIDPSRPGCHSLEATDFLIHRRRPDTSSHFLLWQAECAGDAGFNFAGYRRHNFDVLIERLQMFYPTSHPVIIYEASFLPQGRPLIVKTTLGSIRKDELTGISTLYFPPAIKNEIDQDMCRRLGL
ncbi:SAM-dependent methyltransferase [Corallococcus terminator]